MLQNIEIACFVEVLCKNVIGCVTGLTNLSLCRVDMCVVLCVCVCMCMSVYTCVLCVCVYKCVHVCGMCGVCT